MNSLISTKRLKNKWNKFISIGKKKKNTEVFDWWKLLNVVMYTCLFYGKIKSDLI